MLSTQINDEGKTECQAVLNAFNTEEGLDDQMVCHCVNVIDQQVLDPFECYLQDTDWLWVKYVKDNYCSRNFPITLNKFSTVVLGYPVPYSDTSSAKRFTVFSAQERKISF